MLLDFRDDAGGSPEIDGLLGEVAEEMRAPFNALIERLLVANGRHRVFWFTRVMSRNNLISPLFARLCRLVLLLRLVERGREIEAVRVDSGAMATVLRTFVAARGLEVRIDHVGRARRWLQVAFPIFSIAKSSYFLILCALFAARGRPRRASVPTGAITLLDGFITPGSIDGEGAYIDRYYPGLHEHLSAEERALTWHYPTLLNLRHPREYRAAFGMMRRADPPFLVREDYLRLADYAGAMWAPWRLLRARLDGAEILGFDVAPLIREELWRDLWSKSLIDSLLKYRLPRRLEARGVALRLVVDWFENQVIDRASVMGFRAAYPATPIVGYQGYIHPRHYLCTALSLFVRRP